MKICIRTGKGCPEKGKPQPESAFRRSKSHVNGTCESCRLKEKKERGGSDYGVGDHWYTDPWYELCLNCVLDECIRAEGEYVPLGTYRATRDLAGCLVYEAARRGMGPEEALRVPVNMLVDLRGNGQQPNQNP